MEHNLPPVLDPEQFAPPEAPSRKKARWNLFGAFKKYDAEPEAGARQPEAGKAEASAEHTAEAPKRRRFGTAIMALLQGEATATEARAPLPPEHKPLERPEAANPKPDRQPTEAAKTEQAPEPTIIERAQEVGRGVLRLLNRVKQDVMAADQREQVEAPTNIQPLAEADERIRAAMQELIAPIEAYAAEQGIATASAPEAAAPATSGSVPEATPDYAPASDGGEYVVYDRHHTSALEAATAIAAATAEAAMEGAAERTAKRHHRLGLFAVGAATVGVLVYNWRRQRFLRKEQLALKKEQKRFEQEVREQQHDHRQRMEQLEQVQVANLTQAQRQEHVHAVSRFATQQAEVIHTVAEHREDRMAAQAQQRRTERHAYLPERAPAQTFIVPAEQPHVRQPEQQTAFAPAEAPRHTFADNEVHQPERRNVVERAIDALAAQKPAAQAESGGSTGGGVGGWAQTLVSLTTGQTPGSQDAGQPGQPQPAAQIRRSNQEWLLGVALAIGVAGVLLLLMNIL